MLLQIRAPRRGQEQCNQIACTIARLQQTSNTHRPITSHKGELPLITACAGLCVQHALRTLCSCMSARLLTDRGHPTADCHQHDPVDSCLAESLASLWQSVLQNR